MAEKNSITYEFIQTNGIKLHVAFAGKKEGEPVILLHGFPDASFGWEFQMEALANKGFYVIAPDQRGYNLSDKPKGKKRYMMNLLVTDIIGLADSLNIDKFNLAGHDFGAIVSWNLMQHHSERIKHLVIFNVPHPKVMARYQKKNKDQRKRSWYAFFFIMPLVPELYLKITNRKRLILSMNRSFSEEKLKRYKKAWSQPGAMKAMINWYRCMFLLKKEDRLTKIIEVPTLIIWGKKDKFIKWEMAQDSADLCVNARVEFLEDASHWVLEDESVKTSNLLIEFFSKK